uniref:Glutathione S-transferase 1-like n=1 Tax=Glossina brevipalpis TaxID=37001 RepID=A0A1A9WI28_9MUSC
MSMIPEASRAVKGPAIVVVCRAATLVLSCNYLSFQPCPKLFTISISRMTIVHSLSICSIMGKLTLYGIDLSPPVRACLMTLKALNLPFEYKTVDLSKGEHLTQEYRAKNPQHTVPTLDDDGHIIWDSHAIMAYLVNKYGKNDDDPLYPKDWLKRAVVDQRLHFESGVIFEGGLRNITSQLFSRNDNKIPKSKMDAILAIYDFLEVFLTSTSYVAGSNVTIADFSIVSTVTTLVAFIDIDVNKYPKLLTWLNRMEALPYYQETNGSGAQRLIITLNKDSVGFPSLTKQYHTNMGKLILYGLDASPPVRACLMTLKALDIPFEYKIVDLLNKEHLREEYIAKNPQHTVPTLEDDGNFIWDSHAIMAYLVSKYGKDDVFYPKDLLKRALLDQRLHFECGVMFQGGLRNITAPLFFKNETKVPRCKIDAIIDIYNFLELFLKNGPYMAGNHLTIADFSIVSTVTSLINFVDIDAGKYPKLMAWLKRMEELPYYQETNGKGAQIIKEMIKSKGFTIVD